MDSGHVSLTVGVAVKRKEDPKLLIEEGIYTGDVELKGMAYLAALVAGSWAHLGAWTPWMPVQKVR